MKLKRALSLLLSAVMLLSFLSFSSVAYAATSVEDGVVIVTDTAPKINKHIYFPNELKSNTKKYPVIVWANGTGCQPSMYNELFKGFAKQGYIVVASDETMAADGKEQIACLDYIIAKSKSSSHILYNRVITNKITAMGHSQGGRSAVNAAAADKRFCCVVSIAGSNYQDEAKLLKAPTLFLTGTSDSIVSSSKWVKPAYDVCKGAAVYASLIGAKHTTCCNEPDKYIGYCVSWIKAWTNADDKSLSVFKSGGALSADASWRDVTSKNLTNNISGEVKLSATKFVYNGKVKKPSVTVKDYRGATISTDNYTVTYDAGRKNVGKYKVTIKYRNKYSGTKTLYFTIVPKGTSVSSLAPASKAVTVKWKKQAAQTTGYQLQYATNAKFTSAKTVTIAKNTTVTRKISKLAAKKKYYVRVRTYKKVGSATYYSAWSSAKSTTTK